jgi:hypothetical protein
MALQIRCKGWARYGSSVIGGSSVSLDGTLDLAAL